MHRLITIFWIFLLTLSPLTSMAQHDEWVKIDTNGQAVIDLSDVDNIASVEALNNGVSLIRFRTNMNVQCAIVWEDGTIDPRRFQRILSYEDGYLMGITDSRYERSLITPQRVDIAENFCKEHTVEIRGYLGEGFVLAAYRSPSGGIYDLDGRMVMECFKETMKYLNRPKSIDRFSEDLCALEEAGSWSPDKKYKWGAIDTSGKLAIPYIYDRSFRFKHGKALVEIDGERFWIDRAGERVDAPVPPVKKWLNPEEKTIADRQYTLVDSTGDAVCDTYAYLSRAPEGIPLWTAKKKTMDRAPLLLDAGGRVVLGPEFGPQIQTLGTDGLVTVYDGKYGYANLSGRLVVKMQYDHATPFRDGFAWVCRTITNPDLEGMRYPENYFAENVDKVREGDCLNGRGRKSMAQPGQKYAYLYSGEFKNGIPEGRGVEHVPQLGKIFAEFVHGEYTGVVIVEKLDGTTMQGEFDRMLSGTGHSRHVNGELDFYGIFRNGKPWEGRKYLGDDVNEVILVREGIDRERSNRRGYSTAKKEAPASTRMPTTITCYICYGSGMVKGRSRKVKEYEYSMIMPGDKNWMRGYTHYEKETGREVTVDGGMVPCSLCRGEGTLTQ